MTPTLEQFEGCLLGQAVGDALGAPFEGVPPEAIYYQFGFGAKIVAAPPVEELIYTDDTQMMIGVAETLRDHGRIDDEALASAFARNYQPDRGYGPGAARVIEAIRAGGDWRHLAATIYPGGSLGNGAAMRAAPIGLFFADDLDRVWDEARRSALPTHVHPIGIEGAQLVALAVALAARTTGSPFDADAFYRSLLARAATDDFLAALELAARLGPDDAVAPLGNGIEAHRSVVTAIASFARPPDSYAATIARAVALGGDCDTIAAMAGALSGARLGVTAIPAHLLTLLEDGPRGRTYLHRLAAELRDATEHRDVNNRNTYPINYR